MKLLKILGSLLSVLLFFACVILAITAALLQIYWGSFTPIIFYGKVTDTHGNPVSYAQVYVSFASFPYSPGIRDDTESDKQGNFCVIGHGEGVVIMVSKGGYYTLNESSGNFSFLGPKLLDVPYTSATFTLRKMGETEPLIVQNKNVKTSRDGTPVFMDLHTGRTYGLTNGDIQVQTWTQDQNSSSGSGSHYDWGYAITVPGGGLQSRTGGAFDFTAPEDGYQSTDEVKMSASDPKWDSRMTREYFIKLANGEYARVSFTMYAGGDNFFSIASYLNPQPGHRNLEYDPNQTASK
jgi:hypothetical protein